MSEYLENDCSCGYATHSTNSCGHVYCRNYFDRELKCARLELKVTQETAMEKFTKRLTKAVLKE